VNLNELDDEAIKEAIEILMAYRKRVMQDVMALDFALHDLRGIMIERGLV
jgi:hypothetical protein